MQDVFVEGRIDQINPATPREPGLVQLVDYKTGRPRTQKKRGQEFAAFRLCFGGSQPVRT